MMKETGGEKIEQKKNETKNRGQNEKLTLPPPTTLDDRTDFTRRDDDVFLTTRAGRPVSK